MSDRGPDLDSRRVFRPSVKREPALDARGNIRIYRDYFRDVYIAELIKVQAIIFICYIYYPLQFLGSYRGVLISSDLKNADCVPRLYVRCI